MIRAVIFDFGGVLMRTQDDSGRRAWESRLNLAHGALERLVHGSNLWIEAQRGSLSPEAYWQALGEQLNLSGADLEQLRYDYFRGDVLDESLVALIDRLRERGLRLGLLSNDSTALAEKLERLDLYRHFDAVAISAQIGALKPEPEAFRAIAQALDVSLPECIFIDDNTANVDGAKSVGMHSIRFTADLDLEAALEPLLNDPRAVTKALIFDFGNVLDIPDDWETWFAQREALVAPYGISGEAIWYALYHSEAWQQVKVGAISYETYLEQVLAPLNLPDHAARLAFVKRLFAGRDRIHPEMMALLRELKPHYRLALLSNAYQTDVSAWMAQFGLSDIFEVAISSAVVRLAKPEPAIYHLVLEQLNVQPAEAIFIDDLTRNTYVAESIGLPCIVFKSPEQLRHALEWRGILPVRSEV
ncbi:MAG: HAD family phosphatase [Anaerolineae bacterium]|nr:HAD family phosphatase [Anaerolineae bacterium]MDW8298218.1 HAD family phosphatase [Anaerolineae bacterium]